MSIELRKMNYFEYIEAFSRQKNALMNFFVSRISYVDEALLGLFDNNIPIGIGILLCRDCPKEYLELSYLFIVEEERGKGHGKFLLHEICRYVKDIGKKGLSVRVVDSNKMVDVIQHILELSAFKVKESAHIFECKITKEKRIVWYDMIDNKYAKMYDWMIKRGFCCTSFKKIDDEILDRVIGPKNGFDSKYNLSLIMQGSNGEFLEEYSFLAHFNGEPAAVFMVVKVDDRSLVVQVISVAKKYKKTGAMLLPVIDSISLMYEFEYERVQYSISGSNAPMINVADKIFVPLMHRKIKQLSYITDWS